MTPAPDVPATDWLNARDLVQHPQILLPAQDVALPDPRVWTNASAAGDPAFARWLHWSNAARHVAQPAVTLGRFPAGVVLYGASPFNMLWQDHLVRPHADWPEPDPHAAALRTLALQAATVDQPCLLACHPGTWTWGHWLLDTLPHIVLAEQAQPKLFTYALPAGLFEDTARPAFVRAVAGSLAAYGIAPARCLRIKPDKAYRFSALFTVLDAAAWPVHPSLRMMHPGVVTAMRDHLHAAEPPVENPTVAFLRAPGTTRSLANHDAVAALLATRGAHVADPAALSFGAQVALMRGARIVVAELGSNLATLIYAAPGTGLVSLAPGGWRDSYFVNIAQLAGVMQADVRGPSLPGTPPDPAADPYAVPEAAITQALHALHQAKTETTALRLDGRQIARRTGLACLALTFGTNGSAKPFQAQGFAPPEATQTWSLGAQCRIVVPNFIPPNGDLWLEIEGGGFVAPPALPETVLEVFVNGHKLARLTIDALVHAHVLVPAFALANKRGIDLAFATPMCASPASLNISTDSRPLGFAFRRIALRHV